MARWTITLRELVSMSGGIPDDGYAKSYAALGLDKYPIYDETHRSELNAKIVRHYFMREIGTETIPMFRLYMDEAMRLIMPGYNKLYQSALLDVQHFAGVTREVAEGIVRDLDKTGSLNRTRTDKGTSTNTSSDSADSTTKYLDTAQGAVKNLDDGYLTWVQKDSSTSTGNSDGSTTGETKQTDGTTDNEDESTDRTLSEKLTDPRFLAKLEDLSRGLLNIDRMVVNDREVAQCFMGIW